MLSEWGCEKEKFSIKLAEGVKYFIGYCRNQYFTLDYNWLILTLKLFDID